MAGFLTSDRIDANPAEKLFQTMENCARTQFEFTALSDFRDIFSAIQYLDVRDWSTPKGISPYLVLSGKALT